MPYTPATQVLRYALIVAALLWAIYMINRGGVDVLSTRPFAPVIILAIALFYPVLINYAYSEGRLVDLVTAAISFIIVLALFSIRITIRDLSIIGHLGALTGAISLGMAWLRPESAYIVSTRAGQILAGPFNNSDILATILILSLPFVFLIRRRLTKVVALGLVTWPIVAGGSTTSVIALCVFVLVGSCLLIVKSDRSRSIFCGLVSVITFLAVLILPLLVSGRETLTGRGAIWLHAKTNFSDFILFGAGAGWFRANQQGIGYLAEHAHHLLLEPLIIGGLPYFGSVFILLCMLLQLAIKAADESASSIPALYFLMLIITGGLLNTFMLDLRDLRYIATGFVIVTLLSIATVPKVNIRPVESHRLVPDKASGGSGERRRWCG